MKTDHLNWSMLLRPLYMDFTITNLLKDYCVNTIWRRFKIRRHLEMHLFANFVAYLFAANGTGVNIRINPAQKEMMSPMMEIHRKVRNEYCL